MLCALIFFALVTKIRQLVDGVAGYSEERLRSFNRVRTGLAFTSCCILLLVLYRSGIAMFIVTVRLVFELNLLGANYARLTC